jgi:hypothetical protein
MASFTAALSRSPLARFDALRRFAPALLFAAIGIELLVLRTWLPDTLDVWFHPDTAGYGDFPAFYRAAQHISLNATYSPGLSALMYPLTYLSQRVAFQIYFGVNVAALLGIAAIAQSTVTSWPAKLAVALGVLALPQTHWALRVGHFTEILTLALLAGLLVSERRPVLAGLLLGVLALKPQYLPVPLPYLAWARNWRAVGSCVGMLAALTAAGVGAMALRDGAGIFAYVAHYYGASVGIVAYHITIGQQSELYVQGWQYSWYGFLVSIGAEPNPLIAGDLMLLSLGVMALAWWKCTPSVAKAATVLGMLLLQPHTTFYNWSILAAGAALLLRSDLRPRGLVPVIIAGLALAAAATQNATPWPIPYDRFRPPDTRGFYWLQPATLVTLFVLAIAGARQKAAAADTAVTVERLRRFAVARVRVTAAPLAGAALATVCAGFLSAAYVTGSGPFGSSALFNESQVMRALPVDFPVPSEATVEHVGAGSDLPYRIDWQTDASTSEVAGILREKLADGTWRIVESQNTGDGLTLRTSRGANSAGAPIVADVQITASGQGSRVRLEFTPLPSSSIPGYQRWLESIGVIVHNVDPATDDSH